MKLGFLFLGAAALLAAQHGVKAHSFDNDLLCEVRFPDGRSAHYAFTDNTSNADGTIETFVETHYDSGGKTVEHDTGSRPIWVSVQYNGGFTMTPRTTPAWHLDLHWNDQNTATSDHREWPVSLVHNSNPVAWGKCVRAGAAPQSADTVPDIAPE